MPLAFESLSHGRIAFGFFHIDVDMLLLEELFFFADAFCEAVIEVAGRPSGDAAAVAIPGYAFRRRRDVGDLGGAIQGVRHVGFLGDVYRDRPFPEREEDFRQDPEGRRTRDPFRMRIAPYTDPVDVPLAVNGAGEVATIGAYRFARDSFRALVRRLGEV